MIGLAVDGAPPVSVDRVGAGDRGVRLRRLDHAVGRRCPRARRRPRAARVRDGAVHRRGGGVDGARRAGDRARGRLAADRRGRCVAACSAAITSTRIATTRSSTTTSTSTTTITTTTPTPTSPVAINTSTPTASSSTNTRTCRTSTTATTTPTEPDRWARRRHGRSQTTTPSCRSCSISVGLIASTVGEDLVGVLAEQRRWPELGQVAVGELERRAEHGDLVVALGDVAHHLPLEHLGRLQRLVDRAHAAGRQVAHRRPATRRPGGSSARPRSPP